MHGAKRMKLFISGPMTGVKNHNYPVFEQAESVLRSAGYEVVSPRFDEDGNLYDFEANPQKYEYYVKIGLRKMLTCDAVAILDGWMGSKGAKREVQVADWCGMRVAPVRMWLAMRKPA